MIPEDRTIHTESASIACCSLIVFKNELIATVLADHEEVVWQTPGTGEDKIVQQESFFVFYLFVSHL